MSKGDLKWNDIQLVKDISIADYFVVFNYPNNSHRQIIEKNENRTIVFQMEPESTRKTWGEYYKPNKNKFFFVHDTDTYRNNLEWWVQRDYSELSNNSPKKTKKLSAVVSNLMGGLDG